MNYKVKYKPRSIMGDYQGLHNNVPYVRFNVPRNEIWIRKDIHDRNPQRSKRIMLHEFREIRLMNKGDKYKTAHKKAGY